MEESAQPRPTDAPSAELGFALPEPARLSRGRAITFFVLGAIVLGGVFVSVLLPKNAARASLEHETRAASGAALRLAVAPGKLVSSERVLKLPASVQPLEEAIVYARANGYVARWLVDLGDKVKADQLLLAIETPEINQELSQARAALAKSHAAKVQAEAGRDLSKSRFDRTGKLVEAGVASQAELEQTQAESSVGDANINVAQAGIEAELANIRRLTDVQRFSKVTAPFAGTITSRMADGWTRFSASSKSLRVTERLSSTSGGIVPSSRLSFGMIVRTASIAASRTRAARSAPTKP